jgi:KaiC/GvpD/RAD55 family RecA-like ATPase
MKTASEIAAALFAKKANHGWMAKCPAHKDNTPSLSISEGADGRALVKCFAGCEQSAVLNALKDLGLWGAPSEYSAGTVRQMAPSSRSQSWVYKTAQHHRDALKVVRTDSHDGKKRFAQFKVDGDGWAPGRGNEAIAPLYHEEWAGEKNRVLFFVEGEKCADAARSLGVLATCIPGGANGWRPEYEHFFKGRRVFILPDNDEPGFKFARQVEAAINAAGSRAKIIELPGLGSGEDIADWIKAGGNAEKLKAIVAEAEKPKLSVVGSWSCVGEDMVTEHAERLRQSQNRISTGIHFVDLALGGGISKNDVVLVGAKTGLGKTEFVSNIAAHAIQNERRVHMFALEAEAQEIARRIKYKHVAKLWHTSHRFDHVRHIRQMNYVDWLNCEFDDILRGEEMLLEEKLRFEFEQFHTRYLGAEKFTVETLQKEIEAIADKTDLIIVDHLHFLDIENPNENRGMSDAVSTIRKIALGLGKPIICAAHVRKSESGKGKSLVPDIEDFQGTSNIPKMCTKAVMLAPAHGFGGDPTRYPTFIKVAKMRRDSSRTWFTAVVDYDISKNAYDPAFRLGKLSVDGTEFKPIAPSDAPYWARPKFTIPENTG